MKRNRVLLGCICLILMITLACNFPGQNGDSPTDTSPSHEEKETPTPTPGSGGIVTPTVSERNACNQLSGSLDVYVMAGPGEAVGLDPFLVASVPFQVTNDGGVYLVQGSGAGTYNDILTRDWGTYEVSMDLQFTVSGECLATEDSAQLDITLTMEGRQSVVIESPGLSGEYPWEGSTNIDFSIPVVEGASASGEGWQVVLHLKE